MFRFQDSAGAFLSPPSEEGRNLLPLPRALVHEWVVTSGIAEFVNSPWVNWWLGWVSTPGSYRHLAMIFQDSVFHTLPNLSHRLTA